ncbi:MAG: HEPN domain-containing protein [archaeon]
MFEPKTFEECLNQRLLRKIKPSTKQALSQLEKAAVLLDEAKSSLETCKSNSAFIVAYTAMLDSAKAVLFRDGFREKSHACVIKYLETNYLKEFGVSTIKLLDGYREKRHRVMYDGEFYADLDDATRIVNFATEFIKTVKKIVDSKK